MYRHNMQHVPQAWLSSHKATNTSGLVNELLTKNSQLRYDLLKARQHNIILEESLKNLQAQYDEKLHLFNALYRHHCTYKAALEASTQRSRATEAELASKSMPSTSMAGSIDIRQVDQVDHVAPSQLDLRNNPSQTQQSFSLGVPTSRARTVYLTTQVANLTAEVASLKGVCEGQRGVIQQLWGVACCAHSLELALRMTRQEYQRRGVLCRKCYGRG